MQEGFTRLWRGTNASLALAMPSVSYLFCLEFFSCVLLLRNDYTVHFGSTILHVQHTFSYIQSTDGLGVFPVK
jgi:hypothetical protein